MSEEIQNKILKFLEGKDWPVTTEDVADGIDSSWNTAQMHLIQLREEDKVKYRKVGRQNQWWLSKKYKEEFQASSDSFL